MRRGTIACCLMREEYHSFVDLAAKNNVTVSAYLRSIVIDALIDEGYTLPKSNMKEISVKLSPADRALLCNQYQLGWSCRAIAEYHNITLRSVSYWVKKHGVQRRRKKADPSSREGCEAVGATAT